jgi:hopanoid biosynthesis associated protein HpnK
MKQLIVNGDDFGFTCGVNRGIVQAFREGILTSTTLMANGEAFEDAIELARANPRLGVGCHIVLVGGRAVAPVAEVSSLVDRQGCLPKTLAGLLLRLTSGRVHAQHLESEIRAQLRRIHSAGIDPTHLDTHKHTHMHPRVMEALARVAGEFGIRCIRRPFERIRNLLGLPGANGDRAVRLKQSAAATASRSGEPVFRRVARTYGLRTPDHFYGLSMTGLLGHKALVALLERLPEGTAELMCHPGICDEALERAPTRLKHQRECELRALVDPDVRRAVAENGIQLIGYKEFAEAHV